MRRAGGESVRLAAYCRYMARAATRFVCSHCAEESAKWHGQCPGCSEWNTMVEEAAPATQAGR
ncbi:MAG: hypothetical protein QOI78_6670, partial [Actinomycetota bacterium]|nr:hypothetical protein [Actinomycetota bacterium]